MCNVCYSAADVVLRVQLRDPQSGEYGAARELVWNSGGQGGPTPAGLRLVVAASLGLPPEHTVIAKHLREKYEWIVIKTVSREKVRARGCSSNRIF